MPAFEPNATSASTKTPLRTAAGNSAAPARRSAKVVAVGARRHQQEHRHEQHETEMRHGRVPQAGVPRLGMLAFGHDEEVRRDGHELPRQQEREHVRRARHEAHPEQKAVEHQAEDAERSAALVRGRVGDPVHGRGKTDRGDQRQKERAEEIEPKHDPAGGGDQVRERDVVRTPRRKDDERGREAAAAADEGAKRGDQAGGTLRRRQRGQEGAGRVTGHHHRQSDARGVHP